MMKKTKYIQELSRETGYDEETCIAINEILEHNFFLSKKNKPKIIKDLIDKLKVNSMEAEKIYSISIDILKSAIKESVMHPFKNKEDAFDK